MAVTPQDVRLTSLSHGAGCACKIGAADLAPIVQGLVAGEDPRLLVGADTADDAAVYRLSDEIALVVSADFFTPIVDDPYDFGRVAAANALSDIYAMGATPILALNLVAFSLTDLGSEVLGEILRGGAEVVGKAGAVIGGGHSIDDREPKYGLSVTGTVHPDRIFTNSGARPGDLLFLTKPIGGGLVTTAAKRDIASEEVVARAIATMAELNAAASQRAVEAGASAMTDITGFGLLGHLHELCEASGVAARIDAAAVPAIDGALELAADERCVAGGSRRNAAHAAGFATWSGAVDAARRVLLTDAMTSGGLLAAVPEASAAEAPGIRFGEVVEGPAGAIAVE